MTRWRLPESATSATAATRANRQLSQTEQQESEREFAFQVRAHRLPAPEQQHHWARDAGRQFRADFAWPSHRLLVEVQGGIWMPSGRGAHSGGAAIKLDIERAQYAVLLGWWRLPVTTDQVRNGEAIDLTRRALLRLGWDGAPATHTPQRQGSLV